MTTVTTIAKITTMTTKTAIEIQIQIESDLVNECFSDTVDYY